MSVKKLGFMQLAIVVGFCLYYGYYLIAFFGAFIELPEGEGFVAAHLGQAVFFLGSIAGTQGLLMWYRHRNSVALAHARFFFLASLVPGSISPALIVLEALAVPLPLPVAYGCLLAAGVSLAMGFMLWDDFMVHAELCHNQFAHAVVFCIGGVLFLACTALLPKLALGAVCELMLVLIMLLVMFITPRRRPVPDKQAAPVAEFFKGTFHLDVVSAVLNAAFGFAFILLYRCGGTAVLAAGAAAILMDAAASALMGSRRTLLFSGALRLFAAAVSCALLLSVAPSAGVQVLALGAVVVCWFLFRTVHCGCLAALAASNGFSVLYTSTRGKLAANAGFACGLILGCVAVHLDSPAAQLYLTLSVVAAFILASLFFLPFSEEASTPGYRTVAFAAPPAAGAVHKSSLEERCERLAKRYKLSPREREVLSYAAQGRNAKAIAEKLFISESTTKTHMSNLYRKVNVHSQQELLALLDQE